jgi:hypothetical protein
MTQEQPSISDLVRWIGLLQGGADEINREFDARDAAGFEVGFQQLTRDLRDQPERKNEIAAEFLQLVNRYDYINRWLQERDPGFKKLQAVAEPDLPDTQVGSAAPTGPATQFSSDSALSTTGTKASAQDDNTGEPETRTGPRLTSDDSDIDRPRTESGTTERPSDMADKTSKHPWTPELQIQLFKEIFTAVLAFVIIGITAVLAYRSFNMAGDTQKMGDAKDLLTIMLGVAGVVVGYYFGRVPSDARAAQAASRADAAESHRDQIKSTAKDLADDMDDVMAESTRSTTRNGQPSADHSQMRAIRDKLRDLAAS